MIIIIIKSVLCGGVGPPVSQNASVSALVSRACAIARSLLDPQLFCYNGQAHQEGGDCGEVWHALRSVAEEDGEEDRDQPARQIHLLLLRQDQDEEEGCRDLALWLLHEDRSWRRLDVQHHVSRHGQICHQASEGAEGPVDRVFTSPCGSLEHPIIINLSLEPDLCFCLLS